MRKWNGWAVLAAGAAALWLGSKLLGLAEAGITLALMAFGGFGYGAAATRAPLILWAVVCTLAGVGLYGWECWKENQQHKKNTQQREKDEAWATAAADTGRRKAG